MLCLLAKQTSLAQKITIPNTPFSIKGSILDAVTDEPLSFASIYFPGTSIGTKADIDGNFELNTPSRPHDTIIISVIGYSTKKIIIDSHTEIPYSKITLERAMRTMNDFVIKIDKDPGLKLIKKVILAKNNNNYDKAQNYKYEVYNKIELDINKIPPKLFKSSLLLKNFDFIQQYIDSTSEEKPFLPLFLTETLSDYYYQSKPKKSKEIIKASKISGYKNQSVSQMLGSMYQNINIYDNQIPIFDINFISPIATNAPNYYKYQITDTQVFNNKRCFQVIFSQKRSGEHTFLGDVWIHEDDFAIQKVNLLVTKEQNINWVNKISMVQEFTCLNDSLWFLTKDKFYVEFLAPQGEKFAGFLGRKTTSYKKIIVNNEEVSQYINDKKNKSDTYVLDDALDQKENYWNHVRHDSLSNNEKAIYKLVDTIQSLPVYKKYYNLMYLLGTGIKEVGPLEIGSLYNSFSINPIEGNRFRLTLGTTPKLFKNIYVQGYIAYGRLDNRWKYGGKMLYLLNRDPRTFLFAEVKRDIDNSVSEYDEAGSIDNIFNALGRRRGIRWKLGFVEKQRIEVAHSTYSGFRFLLSGERRVFTPYEPLPWQTIFINELGQSQRSATQNELGLEIRYCYKEKFVEGNYFRTSLGSPYPLLKLYVGKGFKGFIDGEYNYTRLRFSLSDHQPLAQSGRLYYNLFAGRTWGILPYPFLEIHPGNEFYYYNAYTFNMMQRYEYISDKYLGLFLEHSLGTFFLKYIPYIRDSRIRTFWNAKALYGGLSSENQYLNMNKSYPFQSVSQSPYIEVGTGLENIFRVLRIDLVYRALHNKRIMDTPLNRMGLFGSIKVEF